MDVDHEDVKAAPPSAMLQALQTRDCNDVLFFPLYGHDTDTECICSVLCINGLNILLDCGWTEACDVNLISPLATVAPHIDLVLLSHADIAHIGALPYAISYLGLKTNHIHCSLPVQHLGHLALYELLASRQDVSEFDAFSFDDIDAAFECIQGVRFGQQLNFSPPSAAKAEKRLSAAGASSQDAARADDQAPPEDTSTAMQATAHAAGHSLGGAVWHITIMNQDFVYAVSFNLKGDSHLHGCSIHSDLHRPAMLITEADCIGRVDPPSSQASDFCAAVVAALRRPTGHVLIPVDTTARVLELLLLLERHWAAKGLSYPIVFLAKTAVSIVTKARAQLEFLSENVQKHFSRGRAGNPFELPHVHATSHIEALNTLPNNSQLVVLAPLASLSVGLARDLLINCGWAGDPANTVLLPLGGGAPGSMAAQLAAHAAAARGGGRRGPQHLRVEVAWRVPLSDDELRERKAAEAAALRIKEEQEERDAAERRQAGGGTADGDATMTDAAADDAADALLAASRGHSASVAQRVAGGGQTHALNAPGGDGGAGGGDGGVLPPAAAATGAFEGVLIDGFRVPEGAVAPMFPYVEPPPPADDYGAQVDLVALFGVAAHDDGGGGSDSDGAVADDVALHAAVDLPMMDVQSSKVVREVRDIVMEAEVRVFDFRSLISQSSFLSMLKAIAPRNVVVLRRPPEPTPAGPAGPAAPLHTLLAATLRGRFSHVHMPQACEVVKMASTAAFAATMTQELSQRVEDAPKSVRPPYRLGWLDSVVVSQDSHTGALLLGDPLPEQRDGHSSAGVYLGNMFVTEVTRRLKQRGVPVEQEGECAVVGESDVLVRQSDKDAHNDLVIEGAVGRLFYQVREEVYQHYRLIPSEK